MGKIKVFIVDDAVMVRQLFSQVINSSKDMEVVGTAADPIMAEKKMMNIDVDVILLDIEMPKMNGLDYLKNIMESNPKPVIICSNSVGDKTGDKAMKAISLGAVELLAKDDTKIKDFVDTSSSKIIQAIKKASNARLKTSSSSSVKPTVKQVERKVLKGVMNPSSIVAIGSSTGGVQVVEQILRDLPANTPPILVVQHMPAGFINSMATRINNVCNITVKEAIDGELVEASTAYISPGDTHMKIKKVGNDFRILLEDGPKVSHHKPSVDVLFTSFSQEVSGMNTTAFILTGMGYDGAAGIKSIKDNGGKTYAQDEASCTVYGMPNEAVKLGAIDKSLSPEEMSSYILR